VHARGGAREILVTFSNSISTSYTRNKQRGYHHGFAISNSSLLSSCREAIGGRVGRSRVVWLAQARNEPSSPCQIHRTERSAAQDPTAALGITCSGYAPDIFPCQDSNSGLPDLCGLTPFLFLWEPPPGFRGRTGRRANHACSASTWHQTVLAVVAIVPFCWDNGICLLVESTIVFDRPLERCLSHSSRSHSNRVNRCWPANSETQTQTFHILPAPTQERGSLSWVGRDPRSQTGPLPDELKHPK
jgi:hypothetical protein